LDIDEICYIHNGAGDLKVCGKPNVYGRNQHEENVCRVGSRFTSSTR
jgi:hypothetical protein